MAIQFHSPNALDPYATVWRIRFLVLDANGDGVTGLTHSSFTTIKPVSIVGDVETVGSALTVSSTGTDATDTLSSGKILEYSNGLYSLDCVSSAFTTPEKVALEITTASGTGYSDRCPVGRGADVDSAGVGEANVLEINGNATSAANLALSALGIITGTCQTGTLNTTTATTDLTGFADDELINGVIVFTGGTAAGQRSTITDYSATNGTVTFNAITTAPVNGDTFVIV